MYRFQNEADLARRLRSAFSIANHNVGCNRRTTAYANAFQIRTARKIGNFASFGRFPL